MTPEEYAAKLKEIKDAQERAIVSQLPQLEREALLLLEQWVDDNLTVKGGSFVVDEETRTALNGFTDAYIEGFTELQNYRGAVSNYLKDFKSVDQLIAEFNDSQGIDIKRANIGPTQELVLSNVIERYTSNGLNAGFVQPLRQLLFNNAAGGLNKKQAMTQLREFIQSGQDTTGKLGQYLEQTAQQGVDSYTGAINTRIMQSFDITTIIMSGSLIETSSLQCRFAINELNGIIERDDWPELMELAENDGLIEGTTFDTLPFNKLHWGCRHEFTPAVLTDKQRRAISKPKTNR